MIEENLLDAVIGLPQNLFYGTEIPAAILIFRRDRKASSDVMFIEASREFLDAKGKNLIREDVEVQKILEVYTKRQSVSRYSKSVGIGEMRENDFNLNIPRYVDTYIPREHGDVDELQKEIDEIEAKLDVVSKSVREVLTEVLNNG
jgi:type I restriction enzyme M protein